MIPAQLRQPQSYGSKKDFPKPRRRLLKTWLHSPRSTYRFAQPLKANLVGDAPDPASVAHWGEHMLIEDTVTVLHRDGTVTSRQHAVTQLAGASQLAGWDELARYHDSRRETRKIIEARLLYPGEAWRKAERKTYRVAAPGRRANQYGRTTVLRFYPLRPGVIVELDECYDSYRVDEFGPTIANHLFLQTAAPCNHRRFVVAVAKPFALTYRLHHGSPAPEERQVKDYHVYTWEVRNAPGCEIDDWTPPVRDFVPWIDVSTSESWAPFAARFRNELEPRQADRRIREIAQELAGQKTTAREKAAAAYTYVASSVRYGRPPSEESGRNIRTGEQVLQDLRGDCKDKSALLVQLLRAMDFDARIAVVLTGDSGRTPFLPSARFNHALVRVEHEGQVHWLDAAAGPFAFGELPAINTDIGALVLGQTSFAQDHISPSETPTAVRRCRGKLLGDGSYEFDVDTRYAGEPGAQIRHHLHDRNEKHRLRVLLAWLGDDYPGASASDFNYGPVDDLANGFSYTCRARLPRVSRRIRDLHLIQIPWAAPLNMSGPLTATERAQPLRLPIGLRVIDSHEIEIPDGTSPYAIPEPVTLQNEWGSYACRMSVKGRILDCQREMRLTGVPVAAERFSRYQEFWQFCSWADSAEIVLRDDASVDSP